MTRARHWAILLLAAGLVLALASGLTACGGSADGALPPPESPPAPAATPAPAVAPVEPPATATPTTPPTPPEPEPEPEPEPPPATCTATTLGVDPATHPDLGADCAALLAAKDTLRGTGALSWDAATALTGWDGVTLSGTPQRVTGLDLRTRQLTGTIPAELGNLTNLEGLSLSQNFLSGPIPAALGTLAQLRSLHLYQNRLTGAIPAELANLRQLGALTLAENALEGCVPRPLGRRPSRPRPAGARPLPPAHHDAALRLLRSHGRGRPARPLQRLGADGVVPTYEALRDGTATTPAPAPQRRRRRRPGRSARRSCGPATWSSGTRAPTASCATRSRPAPMRPPPRLRGTDGSRAAAATIPAADHRPVERLDDLRLAAPAGRTSDGPPARPSRKDGPSLTAPAFSLATCPWRWARHLPSRGNVPHWRRPAPPATG